MIQLVRLFGEDVMGGLVVGKGSAANDPFVILRVHTVVVQ
jgi:hypothetical protein